MLAFWTKNDDTIRNHLECLVVTYKVLHSYLQCHTLQGGASLRCVCEAPEGTEDFAYWRLCSEGAQLCANSAVAQLSISA